ncbi:2-oxo-4-hydroxy-4-carboxy-5-ureidoimidazoline decarboxylase [Streptomyces sp. NPDC018610]|uniref:2-oxo-4-hydroxy-4-carboxy-5-ureidoimidazoline decarboxylase n=1 Tax=Streptomyces sp. NPDC018610 TaxID=3365049 RepID=UPI00378E53CA
MPRRGPTLPAQTLEHFNAAPPDEARRTLLTCLHSSRWAHRLAAHRPYPDLPALLAAADEAAYDLGPDDLTEALAGEHLPTLPAPIYAAASMALSAAAAAYEARFGHTFAICLDGVAPDETLNRVLAAIRSRLANDPEDERVVTADELRRLARQRLGEALRDAGPCPPPPRPRQGSPLVERSRGLGEATGPDGPAPGERRKAPVR